MRLHTRQRRRPWGGLWSLARRNGRWPVPYMLGRPRTGPSVRPRDNVRHLCAPSAFWCNCEHCSGCGELYPGRPDHFVSCGHCGGSGGDYVCERCLMSEGEPGWRGPSVAAYKGGNIGY